MRAVPSAGAAAAPSPAQPAPAPPAAPDAARPGPDLADLLTAAARARPEAAATVLPRRSRVPARMARLPRRHLVRGRRRAGAPAGFRVTSYAELDRRSDAVAAGLTAAGVGPGVRVALLVPPVEDFFVLAFALLKAGAVPVLVDPGIGLRHLSTCLNEVAPQAFVGVPKAHVARRAFGWCPSARTLVTVGPRTPGGGKTLREVERRGARLLPYERPARPAEATAAIAFTSGSTGVPKGVEYCHEHFLAQVDMIRELYDVAPGEVSVSTFPPFALFGPALGLTTVVPRMDPTRPAQVDPRRIVEAVDGFGATLMFGSPALLDTVGRWGQVTGARLPTLRRVISAGAPVSPAVQRRFLGLLGPDAQIHTPYGATEALPVTSIGSREVLALTEPGICLGRPAPGVDVAVVRVTGEALPVLRERDRVADGEVGEIVARGRNVTAAYADRPAATAAAKTSWDGRVAHRMGDLGWIDGQGRLWFAGRTVHRVTTARATLYSVPCEAVFDQHPAVRRSALVGLGRPGRQRPVLCVELERGRAVTPALTRELVELGASRPDTAAVRTVLYHRGFPVDIRHNAKIDREVLAEWAARRLA
jgi:olefin beta-lactone synthetase